MATVFLFFTLLSGSLISYLFGNKKMARVIPITIMTIVFTLYLFGLFGLLRYGVYFIGLIVVGSYFWWLSAIVTKKIDLKHFLSDNKSFLIWSILLYGVLVYATNGTVAEEWDEFAHWADVVKTMTIIDDFATSPQSHILYKSYPPAMALFQYYAQKCNFIARYSFVEWRLYLAYQLFVGSALFTVADSKKPVQDKVLIVIIYLASVPIFFKSLFSTLYIDPFVAIMAAYGISILIKKDRDILYHIEIFLICFSLTLSKDVGILFAILIAFIYCVDMTFNRELLVMKRIALCFTAPISILFSKISWNYEIESNNIIKTLAQKIDIAKYFDMLVFHTGDDYRQVAVDDCISAFLGRNGHGIKILGANVTYLILFMICTVAIPVFLVFMYKAGDISKRILLTISVSVPLVVFGYAIFIGTIYAFRFNEYEASTLASYDRYMYIPSTFIVLVLLFIMISVFTQLDNKAFLSILCIIAILVGNIAPVEDYFQRLHVYKSQNERKKYELLIASLENNCTIEDKIFFLSYQDNGYDRVYMDYVARPLLFSNKKENIIAPGTAEQLVNSREISPNDFMDELINEGYDYVAIHTVGTPFKKDFSQCFENPDEVEDNFVYRVDVDRKLLVKCK